MLVADKNLENSSLELKNLRKVSCGRTSYIVGISLPVSKTLKGRDLILLPWLVFSFTKNLPLGRTHLAGEESSILNP
jgi:hypothetical protein